MIKADSKNKKKRSRSPAESKNSFVKNVTSTVSNFWPSSIKKWFAPSPPSKANGSTPKADATDSSSEDDIPETSVVIQPAPKRMRYNPGKVNHLGPSVSEVNSSTNVDAIESYDIMQSSSSRNQFKMEPNYVSTPIHTVINEPSSGKRERETTVINTPTVINKRKSLYDMLDKVTTKQEIKEKESKAGSSFNNYTQPYFKASLAGSPFYRGKLAYGGAASSYMNKPNIETAKRTNINETSIHDNSVSYSARRIMDLLEHYSSPLSEAKRISPHVSIQNNISFNQTVEKTSCLQCEGKQSYRTQMLHVPSIASLLSLKRRSRLMDTTNTARKLIASHSSYHTPYPKSIPQSEPVNKDNNDKLTTKIKNRVTRTARGDNKSLVNDLPTPLNMPTAVFEIDQNNLPKFNFGNAVGSPAIQRNNEAIRTTSTTSLQSAKSKELSKDVQSPELKTSNDSNLYKFATPVIVSGNVTKIPLQEPKYAFEYPKQELNTTDKREKKKTSQISKTEDAGNSTTENRKDWKCSDCWVNNKPDVLNCVCCSAKKPSDNSICSICQSKMTEGTGQDKCSKCKETQKSNSNSLTPLMSLQNSKSWKCGDCWVDNADTAEKCVCCGLKNPKFSESIEKQPNADESDWKCNDCWIKNKHNIDKCVACGGVKPNSSSNNTTADMNILKAQTDKWECSNCLVKNDDEANKCVCCETAKTGETKKEVKPTTSFNFGINTNTTFKFGIDTKKQVENPEKNTVSEHSLQKSFVFGLPGNKTKNTLPVAGTNSIEAPKLNFLFGIPKQTTTPSTTQSADQSASNNVEFNTKDKESTPVTEEKPQEVPTIKFISSITPTQNASEPKNKVESSKSPHESLTKMANSISSPGVPGMVGKEKSIGFKPVIVQNTTETETSKTNQFTFAQSGIKFSSNLFSTSTTNMVNAKNSGTLPVPITTSTSLFQKSDLNVNPAAGMFQRVESAPSNIFQKPATTSTVSSYTAASKLFSFGSKTENSLPEPTKVKFNFSFGNSNNTDIPPVFNATFRIDKEPNTNPNSNKFTHSSSNNDGSKSTPGKPLVMGNFITPGNNSIMNNASLANNGLNTVNLLSTPDLGNNTLNAGNTLKAPNLLSTSPPNGIFGGAGQKENIWSNTNNSPGNLFVSNGTNNPLQRPATFTFGSSSPSNANPNTGTTFGNNPTNAFNMQNPSSNTSSLFSTPPQTEQNIYGNAQPSNSAASDIGLFGRPNPSMNSFNMQNPTTSIYEDQNQNQFPAPIFNFGTQQPPGSSVFGFGQQPQMPFQSGVYNFGANKSSPQFNMGSATNTTTVRRVRKAVRRTQR